MRPQLHDKMLHVSTLMSAHIDADLCGLIQMRMLHDSICPWPWPSPLKDIIMLIL